VKTTNTAAPRSGRRLGGADIGLCLTRIHHDRYTPYEAVVDEVRARDSARGFEHERLVLEHLAEAHTPIVEVPRDADAAERTLAAMHDGVPFITGGRLESKDRISVGAPDLLVRIGDGYAAVEIKNHKIDGRNGIVGSLTSLPDITTIDGPAVKFRGNRRKDLLQVAHYNRLVEEAGFASNAPVGGVIGSEEPYGCIWVDLTQGDRPIIAEYRSILASTEEAITEGSTHPGTPLHPPWWRTECRRCDWSGLCKEQLETVGDVTLLTRVDIDDRDALSSDGITTIGSVAALEPDDDRLPDSAVVLQARARTAGRLLRRDADGGPLAIPSAPREVDFDIEPYDGEIYLAGFLVTIGDDSNFEPVVDWAETSVGEVRVVAEMFEKLAGYTDDETIVMHWTDYERRTLRQAGERHGLSIPGFATVDEWFDNHALDLCAWARKALISPNGYGLKVIAPLCGFDWRDDDPGGRQSEVWFEHVLSGDNELKDRHVSYPHLTLPTKRIV